MHHHPRSVLQSAVHTDSYAIALRCVRIVVARFAVFAMLLSAETILARYGKDLYRIVETREPG